MDRALTSPPARPASIAYQPALDGLRALAVVMVLLFHGKVSWMGGGYFGVSMFFTLSGFLITSLLLREYEANGRIAPLAFYARRVRRLLPASLMCLSLVCVLGVFDVWEGAQNLRRDAMGALFQVANWVQLFAGESYTDLQSKNAGLPSPLDHYWSLAIEEQFYWIWPLAFWGLARTARRRGWALTAVIGGLTLSCVAAAPIIAVAWGPDAAYWATPARMGEILLGATVAVGLAGGRLRPRRWMAPAATFGVVILAIVLPAAGGPAYTGALPLLALSTAILLLGLQHPGGVTRALSTWPLVALGKISYGVYLYHFPVFVLMSPTRVGWSGWSLLILQLAATLAISIVSSLVIERPIRFGRLSRGRTALWSGLATASVCALVVAVPAAGAALYYAPDAELAARAGIQPIDEPSPLGVATALPTGGPSSAHPTTQPTTTQPTTTVTGATRETTAGTNVLTTSPDRRDRDVDDRRATAAAPASTSTDVAAQAEETMAASEPTIAEQSVTIPMLDRPARILVVGDSTAEATGAGLVVWASQHPELAQVSLAISAGCGFVRGGSVPSDNGVAFQPNCDRLLDDILPGDLVRLQPDVVMLMVTARDVVPREWSSDEGALDPSDRRYVDRMRSDYQVVTDLILSTTTARIAWIRPPTVDPYWQGEPHPFLDPVLHEIREGIINDTVAKNADRSTLIDLRRWMESDGIADDHDTRPDGWHFSADGSLYVAETWLGPQLVAVAAEAAPVSAPFAG